MYPCLSSTTVDVYEVRYTCILRGTYVLSGDFFGGGNTVDNFKDSKKGHNTPVGAFATSQL